MPTSKTLFVRTGALLLIIGLIVLIAVVSATWMLVQRTQSRFEQVNSVRDLRISANSLRVAVTEMESSQRGYILTGDPTYLVPFQASREHVRSLYLQFRKSVEDHPQYQERVARLSHDLTKKVTELEETIDLKRQGRHDDAVAIIATDRGKLIMEEARALFTEIVSKADEDIGSAIQQHNEAASMLRLASLFGGVMIVLIVGGCVWVALGYTRDLISARNEVESLNVGLEQRVRERTQDLMRANEEVQRFAYIVTHDLRAPLVNIMGFTSELDATMQSIRAYVLADGEPLSEQVIQDARIAASEDLPEAISFIRSSTKKMDGLINAILKISRDGKRAIKPETVNLQAVLENSLASVQHQILEAEGSSSLNVNVPSMVTDKLSLEQIIGNLLDNAVKYRLKERPLEIAISASHASGGFVQIDVTDNGRGIPPDDHQRVFDLFRRSGLQDQPGEGIGLAHVRTLVRSMGGDITLTSNFGEGTTFTILLPIDVRTVIRSNA